LQEGLRKTDFVLAFQRQEVEKLKFKDHLLDENR